VALQAADERAERIRVTAIRVREGVRMRAGNVGAFAGERSAAPERGGVNPLGVGSGASRAVMNAEVPVHAGAGLVEEGLGREGGEEAELCGDLAREALETEYRVGLRQRLAGHEIDLVLRVRGLVRVAAHRDALQVAGGEQRVEVLGEVAGALQRVGFAGTLARGGALA
jgi:hypothetical protein